jgi:hypothetical protein
MRKRRVFALTGFGLLLGVYLIDGPSSSVNDESRRQRDVNSITRALGEDSLRPVERDRRINGSNQDLKPEAFSPVLSDRLIRWSELQAKVFRSDAEEAERQLMSRDPDLISESKKALLLSVGSHETARAEMIDSALELLILAGRDADGRADQAIVEILEDPRLEDGGQSDETREQLAGVQAELLVSLIDTANPRLKRHLGELRLGPVGRRLRARVELRLSRNLAESQQILATFDSRN